MLRERTWAVLSFIVAIMTIANTGNLVGVLQPTVVEAAVSGWLNPSTNASLNATVTNPANAYTQNNTDAVFNHTANHKYGGFGFSLPAGKVVTGIEVKVRAHRTNGSGDKDIDVYLTENNGAGWGSAKSTSNSNDFGSSYSTATFGGSTDKWGRTEWTASELSNGNFAVRIHSDYDSGSLGIDHIAVRIYYGGYQFSLTSPTPPASSSTYTWTLSGEKPGPGTEISHFSLQGCWEEKDIKSVTIAENPPAETDDWGWEPINPPGGARAIKINNLNNDNDLPATITVEFNTSYPSTGTVNGWVKQGQALVKYEADGPNCDVQEGTIKVNKKVDTDGNGTFDGGNATANNLGFRWGLNDGPVDRLMGTEMNLPVGGHDVTENSIDGYHLVGWYIDEGSCSEPEGTSLPVKTELKDDDTDTITFCNAKDEEPEPVTLNAWKIVCTDEADLPNWGAVGGPNITASTAQDWVNSHESCSLTSGWDFQWAPDYPGNPGDNTGAAGSPWTSFGATDTNGFTSATITDLDGMSKLWVREVWQSGYIPFTYDKNADNPNGNSVSAEMYCHKDVINYDNFDFINNLRAGETYNCVAWNVAEREPKGTLFVHKQVDTDGNGSFETTITDSVNGFAWKLQGEDEWSTFGSSKSLTPGSYTVQEKNVTNYSMYGWTWGQPDGDICSEIKPGGGNPEVEVHDQQETHLTFCNKIVTGSIHGMKFNDLNGNGIWDEDNSPMSGWTMFLDEDGDGILDDGERSTQTNGSEGYEFSNLLPGTYSVCEVQQLGWKQTYPQNEGVAICHSVTVNTEGPNTCFNHEDFEVAQAVRGELGPQCNFGNQQQATITVLKNVDENGDGDTTDPNETGSTVWTWDVNAGNQNFATGSTQTVTPGTVTINEDMKDGYSFTSVTCDVNEDPFEVAQSTSVSFETFPGGNYTCTFTNTRDTGTITLNKVWSGQVGQTTLNIGTTAGGTQVDTQLTGAAGAAPLTTGSNTVATGTYFVSESGTPANFTATLACTDNGQVVVPGANNSVAVAKGHAVVCTFTNTAPVPQVLGISTELGLTKSVSTPNAAPGDIITYTLVVTNDGLGEATNVVVTDNLPNGFVFLATNKTARTWNLGTLAAGESKTLTYKVLVTKNVIAGEHVNRAFVTADFFDPLYAEALVTVKIPQVLGLATSGAGLIDYLTLVVGLILVAAGVMSFRQLRRRGSTSA